MGEFGVVLMVGGNIPGVTRTVSIDIFDRVQASDYAAANANGAAVARLLLCHAGHRLRHESEGMGHRSRKIAAVCPSRPPTDLQRLTLRRRRLRRTNRPAHCSTCDSANASPYRRSHFFWKLSSRPLPDSPSSSAHPEPARPLCSIALPDWPRRSRDASPSATASCSMPLSTSIFLWRTGTSDTCFRISPCSRI